MGVGGRGGGWEIVARKRGGGSEGGKLKNKDLLTNWNRILLFT